MIREQDLGKYTDSFGLEPGRPPGSSVVRATTKLVALRRFESSPGQSIANILSWYIIPIHTIRLGIEKETEIQF